MSDFLVSESSAGHFVLQGDLNRNTVTRAWIHAVSELQSRQNAGSEQLLVVDLSGIKDVDTAGLAWLINLLKNARQRNIQFQLNSVPSTLINLAKISDVDNFLSVQ